MESDMPIELLAAREWNGTKWHYPNIERMVEENTRLRADLAAAIKQRDEARIRVCELCARMGGVYRRVNREVVECRTPEEIAEVCGWHCFKEGGGA